MAVFMLGIHTTWLVAFKITTLAKGLGALYTSTRRPVRLIYSETHVSELAAIARELQIKKWSRAKKKALIEDRKNRLHELSKSRD